MTKQEMIDYIEVAKKDKTIRRLMKTRKVQDVEVSYSKVVITIAYKAVKQIKEDLGCQKIQIMLYGKKEFKCDNQPVIPERKVTSQEPSKRSLRQVIIKCLRTGEEYIFYTGSFMKKTRLFYINENGEKTFELPYLDLKKGDKLYKEYSFKNTTYNYELDELCGELYLWNRTKNAFYHETYEVIEVKDKKQNYLVYQITNNNDNIKYFGITNNFKQRYNAHFNEQKESDKMLYHHMKEIGIEHFKMKPLYENIPTKRLAEKIETILIIGNIGSVSNEHISCQKWYDGHYTLNDIKGDYTLSWFSTADKEMVFLADYHEYLHTNYINFMIFEESSKEEIIANNLKELGLSSVNIDNVLSHDRNKVVSDK